MNKVTKSCIGAQAPHACRWLTKAKDSAKCVLFAHWTVVYFVCWQLASFSNKYHISVWMKASNSWRLWASRDSRSFQDALGSLLPRDVDRVRVSSALHPRFSIFLSCCFGGTRRMVAVWCLCQGPHALWIRPVSLCSVLSLCSFLPTSGAEILLLLGKMYEDEIRK